MTDIASDDVTVRLTHTDGHVRVEWEMAGASDVVTLDKETGGVIDSECSPLSPADAGVLARIILGDLGDARDYLLHCWFLLRHWTPDDALPVDLSDAPAPPDTLRGASAYDRQLRPVTVGRRFTLAADPNYVRVGLTRVTDQLPPFLDYVVSTVWLGFNTEPRDSPPRVFETILFAQSAVSHLPRLANLGWRHSHLAAAEHAHPLIVEALSATMLRPLITEGTWNGVGRVKPHRGMNARMRRMAQAFDPTSEGRCRVRGRGGEPDSWVEWSWDPQAETHHVTRTFDPVPRPGLRLAKQRRLKGRARG